MHALKRNSNLKVSFFPSEKDFDVDQLAGKFDIILLPNNNTDGTPELINIKKSSIPVICRTGDPHWAKHLNQFQFHEKWKIDCYFNFVHKNYFYKFYPKTYEYRTIIFGLEQSLYYNNTPFNKRIKNRILNSGATANTKLTNRIYQKLFLGDADPMRHYKLRTMCNKLPYIDYTTTLGHEYIGDKYPLLLNKYAAAIAATTSTYNIKYFEIPAGGCMTFMEVTDKNYAKTLGYKDGYTAIFINEKNYQEKFEEYLNDVENKKWEEIAIAGRSFALENFNNDKGVDSLIQLIKELI
jgi:hypothetical protein